MAPLKTPPVRVVHSDYGRGTTEAVFFNGQMRVVFDVGGRRRVMTRDVVPLPPDTPETDEAAS